MQAGDRSELVTARCHAADEAEHQGAEIYFPHRLRVLESGEPFEMRIRAARFGPVKVGTLAYDNEVLIETDDLETSYEVNIPLRGRFTNRAGQDEVLADEASAVVFGPEGPTSFRGFAGGGELVGLKIERAVLERQLADLTQTEITAPIRLGLGLDLGSGPGREWWRIARSLVSLLDEPDGLARSPLVVRPLVESTLAGLLLVLDHPFRSLLFDPPATAPPPSVIRRAVELLEELPDEAWTVAELARRTGVSVRTLQVGFRRVHGSTPLTYLRNVRLQRVHAELLTSDPRHTSVSDVASRWGFTHLGRFAAVYRERHGTSPSATLRTH